MAGARRSDRGDRPLSAPRWVKKANSALSQAACSIRVIASSTPINLRAELDRLEHEWAKGGDIVPRFSYSPPPDHRALRAALSRLNDELEPHGEIGAVYAARARELEHEAALCEAVGGADFWAAARRRYPRRDIFDDEADKTAAAWLAEPLNSEENGQGESSMANAEKRRSDDESDPSSLISRMRYELGRRKLPLRVIVRRDIASLAATGDGFVQVIADRGLSRQDVERTVMHEIEGHVIPRLASARAPLGIFALGTAFGSDDQEGRALALERERGFLEQGRRREIALRHTAARAVESGLDFPTTARLLETHGAPISDALRIAARVHRGGGLAREVVYLPALLRVEAARRADHDIDRVLASGRVSVDAAPVLRPWLDGCSPD